MAKLVSIQFEQAGKLYDFDAGTHDLQPGDKVIVETERGKGIGTVVRPVRDQEERPEGLKSVLRKARPEDVEAAASYRRKEKEAFDFCLKKITERSMEMKLIKVEYLFDGSKAIFFFTADGRVDFRDLVKDLAHEFHTRIEMRQIGVRDEAKMVGGIGICGRELCCASFLREFEPVSVKMAKEQNLALNPNKISGQCGRLLCCLGYEYDTYCSLKKCLPKCGKHVQCKEGSGEVVKMNIIEGTVTLRTDEHREVVVRGKDIKPDQISDRPKKPREEPPKKPGGRDAKPPHRDQSARPPREQGDRQQQPSRPPREQQQQGREPREAGEQREQKEQPKEQQRPKEQRPKEQERHGRHHRRRDRDKEKRDN